MAIKEKTKDKSTSTKKEVRRKEEPSRRTAKKETKAPDKDKDKKEKKDIAAGYNKFKEFGGKKYTGMKVGRSHKWYYDQGEWKEKKVTPDAWEISYNVTKRRAGRAPEGSGVPVGTEYNWYILAHQHVEKLNANDYSTEMHGHKFKLNHKRAGKDKWSVTDKTERKRLIKALEGMLEDLKEEDGQK